MCTNSDTQEILIKKLHVADTFWKRFLGLIPFNKLADDEGLILAPCNGVHTFFMRFPIDIIYLNMDRQVVEVFDQVKPWKALPIRKNTHYVMELPVGTIARTQTRKGDRITLNL